MRHSLSFRTACLSLLFYAVAPSAFALQIAGDLLVDLTNTGLVVGPLGTWTNNATVLGNLGSYTAPGTAPTVGTVDGVTAVTFAGTSTHMVSANTAPATIAGNDSWSVEAWAFNPAVAVEEVLIGWSRRNPPGGVGHTAHFGYGTSSGAGATVHWGNDMAYGTGLAALPGGGNVPALGKWHHLAFTFDGATEKTYIDGVLNGTRSTTLAINSGEPSLLGASYVTNVGTLDGFNPLTGSMARVRVHTGTLSASDVQTNYSLEKSAFTMYEPRNTLQIAGQLVVDLDASASRLPGSIGSTVTQWNNHGTAGHFNNVGTPTIQMDAGVRAVRFDGGERLQSTTLSPWQITGSSDWSVEVWAYNPTINSGEEPMVAWANRPWDSAQLNYGGSGNVDSIFVHFRGGGASDITHSGLNATAGGWHHIVLTYSGDADNPLEAPAAGPANPAGSGTERLYIDGVLVDQYLNRNLSIAANEGIWLAQIFEGSGPSGVGSFSGSLAQVRIHTGELSSSQVVSNFDLDALAFGLEQINAVPEPSSLALALLGLIAVWLPAWRKGRRR